MGYTPHGDCCCSVFHKYFETNYSVLAGIHFVVVLSGPIPDLLPIGHSKSGEIILWIEERGGGWAYYLCLQVKSFTNYFKCSLSLLFNRSNGLFAKRQPFNHWIFFSLKLNDLTGALIHLPVVCIFITKFLSKEYFFLLNNHYTDRIAPIMIKCHVSI